MMKKKIKWRKSLIEGLKFVTIFNKYFLRDLHLTDFYQNFLEFEATLFPTVIIRTHVQDNFCWWKNYDEFDIILLVMLWEKPINLCKQTVIIIESSTLPTLHHPVVDKDTNYITLQCIYYTLQYWAQDKCSIVTVTCIYHYVFICTLLINFVRNIKILHLISYTIKNCTYGYGNLKEDMYI